MCTSKMTRDISFLYILNDFKVSLQNAVASSHDSSFAGLQDIDNEVLNVLNIAAETCKVIINTRLLALLF
jgi:hypothetical protein